MLTKGFELKRAEIYKKKIVLILFKKEAGARNSRDCYSNNSLLFSSFYIQFTFRSYFLTSSGVDFGQIYFHKLFSFIHMIFNDFLFRIILPVYVYMYLFRSPKKLLFIFFHQTYLFNEIQMRLWKLS